MSILTSRNIRLLVQGITGREGRYHTYQTITYGHTCNNPIVVGGVSPGHGGEWVHNLPVFDTVKECQEATGANASVIYVPPRFALDAILEAIEAKLDLVVCVTDGVPIGDMIRVREYLRQSRTLFIGANSPGLLTPGVLRIGIMPSEIGKPGNVGVVSRSGTLMYEVTSALSRLGIGQSTCVGIGGDPIRGLDFVDALERFEADPHTDKIVLLGEIGGKQEEHAADFIRSNLTKPVVAFIAGKTAPIARRMGHLSALISDDNVGAYELKTEVLLSASVRIARQLEQIPELLQ
jgi:succinyl-CoA synthetase alpha subunit